MINPAQVAENYERVRSEIVAVAGAERAATIGIVAVTKTHGIEAAIAAAARTSTELAARASGAEDQAPQFVLQVLHCDVVP